MRIVIIAQNCFPSLGPRQHRTTELAKEFARRGHEVIVYALLGDYDYSTFSKETGIIFKNLGNSKFGIADNLGHYNRNIFYRAFRKFFGKFFEFPDIELIPMVIKSLKREPVTDLLITIAVPHTLHWATARYIKKNKNEIKMWVADCGDPFMKSPFDFHPFYFKYFEKKWCTLSNYISVPTLDALNGYYKEFRHKIKIIPQGFNFSDIDLAQYKKNKLPTFAYSGFLYKGKRDITQFLEYLSQIKRDFKFIVYTQSSFFFEPFKNSLGQKLELREYIPRRELLYELSKVDFLVNIRNESKVQVPSKLIDYALTGRPILEIASEFKQGEEFERFLTGDYRKKIEVCNIDQYNIVKVVDSFLSLVVK